MVEQSDSFFTVPEDFELVNHKRASPEINSNRPAKKRSLTPTNLFEPRYDTFPPRQPSHMLPLNNSTESRDMAIRGKENEAPPVNHKVSRSLSMAIGRSKETVEPRKLFSRRRMSEARHETWDAIASKTKKFCHHARPHLKSHRDPLPDTLGPGNRCGPASQTWGTRRPSVPTLGMAHVPILPQRTSSLEQSLYASPPYSAFQAPGSCTDYLAHQPLGSRGDDARMPGPASVFRNLQAPDLMLPSRAELRGGSPHDLTLDDPSSSTFSLTNVWANRRRLHREDSDAESGIDMDDSRGTKTSFSLTPKGIRQGRLCRRP